MKTSSIKRVLMAAGGTGGHIFPALAVASALHEQGVDVQWLGSVGGMEQRLVPEVYHLHVVRVAGLRHKGVKAKLFAPFMIVRAILQAINIIRQIKPDVVIAMGGFVAGPAGIAAWLLRIPLMIHEQNSVAGLTNRILAKLARQVFQAFPNTFPENQKVHTVGNPLRRAIVDVPAPNQRLAAHSGKMRLFVLGGSLGAHVLNVVVPQALSLLANKHDVEVWHQTGREDQAGVRQAYQQAGVEARVDAFLDEIATAYAWADLMVCRAGALTVSEVAAVGVASIFIPLPHAVDNHQYHNARYLEQANAAMILLQRDLSAETLSQALNTLLFDRNRLLTMAEHARTLAQPAAVQAMLETQ